MITLFRKEVPYNLSQREFLASSITEDTIMCMCMSQNLDKQTEYSDSGGKIMETLAGGIL